MQRHVTVFPNAYINCTCTLPVFTMLLSGTYCCYITGLRLKSSGTVVRTAGSVPAALLPAATSCQLLQDGPHNTSAYILEVAHVIV